MSENQLRSRNPEETIQRLSDAALALFGQHGYERTTIDKIVQKAGCSKGAFYNHFASKEEFFFYLLEQRLKKNKQRVQTLYDPTVHPGKWLRNLVESLLTFSQEDPNWRMLSIEFMVQGMRNRRIGEGIARMHQDWRQLIVDTVRGSREYQAGLLDVDPEALAASVVALIDGLIIQATLESKFLLVTNIGRQVQQMMGMFVMEEQ